LLAKQSYSLIKIKALNEQSDHNFCSHYLTCMSQFVTFMYESLCDIKYLHKMRNLQYSIWITYNLISFVTQNLIGSFGFTNILHIIWKKATAYSANMTSNRRHQNTFDCNVSLCCYSDIDPQYVQIIDSVAIINQIMSKTIYLIKLEEMKVIFIHFIGYEISWDSLCNFINLFAVYNA
jgi:hypothetical protein